MSEEAIWRHGDVFRTQSGYLMIYIAPSNEEPKVYNLTIGYCCGAAGNLETCLHNATVLYNICERSVHWYERSKLETDR